MEEFLALVNERKIAHLTFVDSIKGQQVRFLTYAPKEVQFTMGTTVLAAIYGTTTKGNNVTALCQQLVDTGNDDILVNNTNMGGDPNPGVVKSFGILYTNPALNNGNPIALGCQENATLDLVPTPPTATTPSQSPLAPVGSIKVIHAVYGASGNGNDVTAICQALVNEGNFTIPVNNTVMGPDPAVGKVKSLGILYAASSGSIIGLACQENTNLTLITS